jgi:hypothetical protein
MKLIRIFVGLLPIEVLQQLVDNSIIRDMISFERILEICLIYPRLSDSIRAPISLYQETM